MVWKIGAELISRCKYKKIPRATLAEFWFYSLDLLELSVLEEVLPELSDAPESLELSDLPLLSDLPELSEDPEPVEEPSDLAAPASLFSLLARRLAPDADLWSVAYQPEPLKTIPAGVRTLRRLFLLHSGQRLRGSSVKDWWRSNCTPQFSQR
jgi:hypothetical protein